MRSISIKVSDRTHHILENLAADSGSLKAALLTGVISKLNRSLATGSRYGHRITKDYICDLRAEIGGDPTVEPRARCPHCLKEF